VRPQPGRRAGLFRFLATLAADNPRRLAWVLAVQVIGALTQGIGLLLLVPLLEVAGVSGTSSSAGSVGRHAREAFGALGVPLTLPAVLIMYAAVVTLAAGLSAYQNVLLVRYRLEFVDALRRRLYRTVARAQWRHLVGLRESDLLTALTVDIGWVGQGTLAVLNLGVAVAVIAVQVAVAVQISPAVTAVAMATGTCLAAVVWPLVRRSRRLGRELVRFNREVLGSVTGFLGGLKLAKTHGLELGHLTNFDEAIVRARRSQIDFAKAQALATAVQVSVTAVVLATLIYVALGRLAIPLAEILVLALIFTRLVPQVTQAQSNVQTLAQSLPSFGELTTLTAECAQAAEDAGPLSVPLRPGRGRTVLADRIRLDGVGFSHRRPGGEPAEVLSGVTLDIPARTTTALVGPSGAGKTTIADLAVGLLVPTSGRVLVDGAPLTGDLIARWRDAVAMVPQEVFLFHDTIRANLLWARPSASAGDLWQALALASADTFVSRLRDGLDTVVGDRGERLSGGERQRIALARALLREPALLVLDEATSSLDAGNETAVLDALARLHGRTTILLIAHQRSALRDADQVITVADGRVTHRSEVLAGNPA
jgi:ATP-binding cassette, subfamily C, bacterial